MRQLIETFPDQVHRACLNAEAASLLNSSTPIQNVVICGLGGSGIGGKIASQLIQDEASVPVLACNDYALPGFVNEHTLVLISSYSGNTEETVSAMNEALKKKCLIACVTSGGEVSRLAEAHGLNCIEVPGGFPPRSQFGYSLVSVMRYLVHYNIVSAAWWEQMKGVSTFLQSHQHGIVEKAEALAGALIGKTPVLYAESRLEGVIIRWRQQINENSKMLCWHHVYPEMNHNEIIGWEGGANNLAVVVLRSGDDHPRSMIRMDITRHLFEQQGAAVHSVEDRGAGRLQRTMYFVHFGDWLSLLLAEKQGVDPVSITSIDFLKNELAKLA
ncbi:MAG: hypothetical protein RL226_1008 [Bacteroidota bacterium]